MYPDAPENGIYIFSDNPAYDGIKLGSNAAEVLGLHDVVPSSALRTTIFLPAI